MALHAGEKLRSPKKAGVDRASRHSLRVWWCIIHVNGIDGYGLEVRQHQRRAFLCDGSLSEKEAEAAVKSKIGAIVEGLPCESICWWIEG
jgi:hypothetical protein